MDNINRFLFVGGISFSVGYKNQHQHQFKNILFQTKFLWSVNDLEILKVTFHSRQYASVSRISQFLKATVKTPKKRSQIKNLHVLFYFCVAPNAALPLSHRLSSSLTATAIAYTP